MKKFTLLLGLSLFCMLSFAQSERKCAVNEHMSILLEEDPQMEQRMEEIEAFTQTVIANGGAERAVDGIITIPVVVHVLYNVNKPQENISDAQIQSQIDVLNEDFRRLNADASETLPVFQSVGSDFEIEFCLASVDPTGAPTNGIERRSSTRTTWGTGTTMKRFSQGGLDAWPMDSYLNMWTCNIGFGILGFATFPGGDPANDGVVMLPNSFGSEDHDINNNFYLQSPFDLGRTTTHEIGHWLNLRHIWGDGGCGVDDGVGDTPTSDASNGGCAINHSSCNSLDMVQNYMDYSNDDCMNIFTTGQKARARALFEAGGIRAPLLNSEACGEPVPMCLAPSGVTVTVDDHEAVISFNGGAYVVGYAIDGALEGQPLVQLGVIEDPAPGQASHVTFTLGELQSCTGYDIRISAICLDPEGVESTGTFNFTTTGPECDPPSCDMPENLYATDITFTQATLGWDATEHADFYRVQGRLKGGFGLIVVTREFETNSFRTNNLFPFLTYEFHVQAFCDDIGASPYTQWYPFTLNPFVNRGDDVEVPENLEIAKIFDTDGIITAYPNPSSGLVNVNYIAKDLGEATIIVTDVTGNEVKRYQVELLQNGSEQIDLSDLNKGLYLLTFRKDGILLATEKVMIAK